MLLWNTLSHSPVRRAAISLALVSLLCTQVPLFNYLGFEFSLLISLVASFLCGLMTLSLARTQGAPLSAVRESSIASSFVLAIPFLIMAANAFFVKNCSLTQGMLFFLLIPIPAVVLMNSLALLLSVMRTRWKKSLFVVIYAAILLHILLVTFTDVQIFAFNPIVGYFPGITYDETIQVEARLALYRISTLALAFLAIMVATGNKRRTGAISAHAARKLLTVVCVLIVAGAFFFSNELGFSSSSGSVRAQLGGLVETDHFVITYPRDRFSAAEAERLAQEHEFQFERLARELRVIPRKKIQSFIYASVEQKQRFIGAGRTNIAKPWLWQIHINRDDLERSLAHELVHVLAADFGSPILRVGWNPGLIEGLAVATERLEYDETIHRLAGMAHKVGVRTNLSELFSLQGFMQASPQVSYTLAGSFCRFLIDRYGWRRFKLLYRSGNFDAHYGKPLRRLMEEWEQFLAGYHLTEGHLRKARYLFKRPSIFARECPRVIAAINSATGRLMEREEYDAAMASARASLERSVSTEAIFQQAQALYRLKRYDEVIRHTDGWLRDTTLADGLLPLWLVRGDALLMLGKNEEARRAYRYLFEAHLTLAYDEASALRLATVNDALARELLTLLTATGSDSLRLVKATELVRLHPGNSLARYILGRQFQAMKRYNEAVIELVAVTGFDVAEMEHMRHRRIARAYFDLGKYQKAKISFWQSLNYTGNEAHAFQVQEWLNRCDWYERQPRGD